jgi:type I restriction enzyme S subunit
MPIIRIQNVGNEVSDFVYWPDGFDDRFVVSKGDLLLTLSGSFRAAVWDGPDALLNQRIVKVIPASDIDTRWLFFALDHAMARIAGLGRHALVSNVALSDLRNLSINVPPLDEQRRIAAILDKADELCRKRQGALSRLKHFPSALMDGLLGDGNAATVHRLDELVRRDDRINYGVVQPGPEVGQGIPLVRVENVVEDDFSRSNLKHISPQIEAQYSRSRLRGDELLVACVGSIGAVALVQTDQRGFNIARAVARIPIDPMKAERVFIAEYLKRAEIQAYFKSETRAVAQPTLNIKQLCETSLSVPALSVQRIFAARVTEINKLKAHHRAHLAKLDALFASLQHRAFRGEL